MNFEGGSMKTFVGEAFTGDLFGEPRDFERDLERIERSYWRRRISFAILWWKSIFSYSVRFMVWLFGFFLM